jgi:phage gpG-like protein
MAESAVQVEMVGLDAALNDLVRWGAQLGPAVEIGAWRLARTVASQTAGKVPKVTGTLAASVRVETDVNGAGVSIGGGVPYAGWIEFGGSRGRPLVPQGRYLYPTALSAEPQFEALANQIADETVREYPWSTPTL